MLSDNVKILLLFAFFIVVIYIYFISNNLEATFLQDIANKFEMRVWQLRKYNELSKDVVTTKANQIVYLQPKRWMAKTKFHIVKSGETVFDISQQYGIKTKWIYRRNKLDPSNPITPGMKLKLR